MNWTPVFQLALICLAACGVGFCVAKWPVPTASVLTLALALVFLCSCTMAKYPPSRVSPHGGIALLTWSNFDNATLESKDFKLRIVKHDPARTARAYGGALAQGAMGVGSGIAGSGLGRVIK